MDLIDEEGPLTTVTSAGGIKVPDSSINTSNPQGSYIQAAPTLPQLTPESSAALWGSDFEAWKNGPTYAADMASANAYLAANPAKAPTTPAPVAPKPIMQAAGAGAGYAVPDFKEVAPVTRAVDPATMTTQGQLDSILSKNGLLMQRAEGLAMGAANARGMQNSSMAAGAGTAAMIDAATPIANADAGVYNQVASENQKYQNAAEVFNSSAYNEAQMAGFNESQKMLQLQFQAGSDMAMQKLKNEASVGLAMIEADFKTAMQSSDSARTLYTDISRNITNIMMSKDIPAEEKARLVAQQEELLRSGLSVAGSISNTDFLQILDFTGGLGTTKSIEVNKAALPTAVEPPGRQTWVNDA